MNRRLRELGLVALAGAALYLGTHGSALPPRVLAPAEQLSRFHPFAAEPQVAVKNPLLLDPILQFVPWLEFSRAELLLGRLPVWNPLPGFGAVHLANDQSAVFSPFSFCFYVFGGVGLLLAGLLKALLLCVGAHLLLRDEGLSSRASLAGGLALSACGPVVAWQLHPHTAAFAWAPLLLFFVGRAVRSPQAFSWWSLGLAATTAATLVAGHVQTAFMVALAAAGWTVLCLGRVARAEGGAVALRRLVVIGLAVGLGLSLALVHLLPFLAVLPGSEAWAEHAGAGISVDVPARHLLLALFPDLHGNPRDGAFLPGLGASGYLEMVGPYVGASLLLLAAAGLPAARKRLGLTCAAGGLVLLAALVVYGPFGDALSSVPPFSLTRNHRLTFLVALGLAGLGALGFDRVVRDGLSPRAQLALGGGLLLLAGVTWQGAEPWSAGDLGRSGRGLGWAVAVPSLCALGALAAVRWGGSRRRIATILGGLLALELSLFAAEFVPGARADELRPPLPELEAVAGARVLAVGQVLPPNTGLPYGLRTVRSYDALGNRFVAGRRAKLAAFQGPLQGVVDWFDDGEADALSVDHVLTDDPQLAKNLRRGLSGWWIDASQSRGGPSLTVPRGGFGQTFPAPRRSLAAFALPSVECARPTSFTLILHRGDGSDPLREVTVQQPAGEGELLFRFAPLAGERGRLHAEIVAIPPGARVVYSEQNLFPKGSRLHDARPARGDLTFFLAGPVAPYAERAQVGGAFLLDNPDRSPRVRGRGGRPRVISETPTQLRIAPGGATWVEVADAWSPGWEARVDGEPTPVVNAMGLRAVELSPVADEVELRYVAPGLAEGGAISLAALFFWGLGASIVLSRRP